MRMKGTALVTGASSGLGIAFAEELARRGYRLVLTARHADALQTVADRLQTEDDAKVVVQPADLSEPAGAGALVAALDARDIEPKVVVNNAGFALNESLARHAPERLAAMLQLNVVSLTELTRIYARRMAAADGGRILLVASMAAFAPAPMMAAYAASKAYVLSLGQALHVELAPEVGVTVLSPGYMRTGFDAASGFVPSPATLRTALDAATVARIGLDALFAGKSSVVAGTANRMAAVVTRLMPRAFLAHQVLKSMENRFDDA